MLISLDAVVVNIIYNGIEEWIPSIGNVALENGWVCHLLLLLLLLLLSLLVLLLLLYYYYYYYYYIIIIIIKIYSSEGNKLKYFHEIIILGLIP